MKKHNHFQNRIILLTMITYLCGSFALGAIFQSQLTSLLQYTLISEIMVLLIPAVSCTARKVDVVKEFRIRPVRLSTLCLSILCLLLVYPIVGIINVMTMLLTDTSIQTTLLTEMTSGSTLMVALCMGLAPALVEELVFRGFIYHGYRRSGPWLSVILSALLFGLFHLNVSQACYAFVIGVVFALVLEASGSILTTMTMHFAFNMLSTVSSTSGNLDVDAYNEQVDAVLSMFQAFSPLEWAYVAGIYATLMVGCFGVIGVLIWLISKNENREEHFTKTFFRKQNPKPDRSGIISLELVIVFAIAIAYIVLT